MLIWYPNISDGILCVIGENSEGFIQSGQLLLLLLTVLLFESVSPEVLKNILCTTKNTLTSFADIVKEIIGIINGNKHIYFKVQFKIFSTEKIGNAFFLTGL